MTASTRLVRRESASRILLAAIDGSGHHPPVSTDSTADAAGDAPPAGDERDHEHSHRNGSGSGSPDVTLLSRSSTGLHVVAVLLSAAALLVGGLANPAIGFQLAVGIVAIFGAVTTPPYDAPTPVLRTIRGHVTHGGMRQGAAIKAMFAAALLYNGAHPVLFGLGDAIVSSLLLGLALAISAVGTLLSARAVTRVLDSRSTDE